MNGNDKKFMAEKIRTQYIEKEASELDALRTLDGKVKRPANIFGYVIGSLSSIVMGFGMSLVMTDMGSTLGIQNPLVPGILIGTLGMTMAILNYPVYKKILEKRKKKYATEILSLSETILGK